MNFKAKKFNFFIKNVNRFIDLQKEFKQESLNFWEEPYQEASKWTPCADKRYATSLGKYLALEPYPTCNKIVF